MGTSRAAGWTIAAASLMLATGCGQGPGQAPPAGDPPPGSSAPNVLPSATVPASTVPASTAPASPVPDTSSAADQTQPSQTAGGGLQINTIPLGGSNLDVEARLPINGYWARPGQEITFDASTSLGTIGKYEWDLEGDGTYDQTTTSPVLKHAYPAPFDGRMILRVSSPLGTTNVLQTPVHIGSVGPGGVRPGPPTNVRAEVVSADGTQVKVTWESDDPTADSWAVAVNGFPAGRVEKSARSVTVRDIRRDKDVLLQIIGITADGALGERAGTTLPAAK